MSRKLIKRIMDNKAVEDFMIETVEAGGEARGMQIGKTENKIAVARNLKRSGAAITIISESTGLTKKQIEELDTVELDDITSSSNDQKIDYNKDNIEKILSVSTNKSIEVFLSCLNKQKQDTTYSSATDVLIERIRLYKAKQRGDSPYYLAIDCTNSLLVDTAYLAQLHYSNKRQWWKLRIIPLVNYYQVDYQEMYYLKDQLQDIETIIVNALRYYDTNIKSMHFEQVVEHAKLRLKYFRLNPSNFQQYESELNSLKLAEVSIYEAHKKILEQSPSDNKYLEETKLNVSQIVDNTPCSSRGNEDYDKQEHNSFC